MALRTAIAPTAPQIIAFFCRWAGKFLAAIAITMALSPAKTKSITTIANKAEKKSGVNSSNLITFISKKRAHECHGFRWG